MPGTRCPVRVRAFVCALIFNATISCLAPAQAVAPAFDPTPLEPPAKFLTVRGAETKAVIDSIAKLIEAAGFELVIDRQACVIDAQRALPAIGRTERREQLFVWFYRDAAAPEAYLHVFVAIGRLSRPLGSSQMRRYVLPPGEKSETDDLLNRIRRQTQKLYE